jgi:predicted dehydrogenase
MRFALLGDHPDALEFARALVDSGRHEVVVYSGSALGLAEIERRGITPRPVSDLEEVLADPAIDAVIVAGGPATRAAQLRRALQSERHVVCVHPADPRPDLAYEAAMMQADTGYVLMPLLPEACHPGIRRLAEIARSLRGLRLITIDRWSTEEILIDAGPEAARPGLPGWDVVRLLGGDLAEISVVTQTDELVAGGPVVVSGHFTSGPLLQINLLPNHAVPRYRISLLGEAGETVLDFPQGWPGTARLNYGDEHVATHPHAWPAADPWAPLVEAFEAAAAAAPPGRALASVANAEPRLGWQDEVRALELDDAARRSVHYHRHSTLDNVEATEEASFKGTMTLVGCGLIWLGLVLLILSAWIPWVGWAIVPIFAIFLAFQLLRWVVPGTAKPNEPESH